MSESVCLCVILFPLQLIMYQTQTLAGGDRLSDIQSGYIQTRTSGTYSLTTFRLWWSCVLATVRLWWHWVEHHLWLLRHSVWQTDTISDYLRHCLNQVQSCIKEIWRLTGQDNDSDRGEWIHITLNYQATWILNKAPRQTIWTVSLTLGRESDTMSDYLDYESSIG